MDQREKKLRGQTGRGHRMPFLDVRRPASIQYDEPIGAREHSKMRLAVVADPLVPRDRGRYPNE